jgi:hypothetical protein
MKNQAGFATVAMVVLLPLLLALFAISAAYFIFKNDGEARHTCRTELLRAQSQIATDLKELLSLNTDAFLLREERRLAEEAVVASTIESPGLGTAAAEIRLAQVIAKQQIFAIKQQLIISRARQRSLTSPGRALESVRLKLAASARVQSEDGLPYEFSSRSKPAFFDVVAQPKDSITPDYQPSPEFQRHQEMKARWSFNVGSFLPPWLRKIVPATGLQAQADCSTTLEKEGNSWEPRITKGKF